MFRNCRYQIVPEYDREDFRKLLDSLSHDQGPVAYSLKEDTTTSVWCAEYQEKMIVIKRYNTKNPWHAFRRVFRQSRADNCWKMSRTFNQAGIQTPANIAVIQEWWGPFKARSWYICEHVPSSTLIDHLSPGHSAQGEIEQIAVNIKSIFSMLKSSLLSHGDFKASNILLAPSGLWLIDLDAARKHGSRKSFERAYRKDLNRFLKNWVQNDALYQAFKNSLC